MKTLIAILLITLSFSSKHLRNKNDGAPLTFTILEENTAKITNYKVKPDSIILGESIEFKMQFQATTTVTVAKLFLDTVADGVSLFTDTVNIGKTYQEGDKDVTGYTATIPSFCPPGSWNIYLTLKDDKDNNVASLLAHFDIQ